MEGKSMRALAAAVAFLVAGVLAYYGKDMWGWFIFAGLMVY